MIMKLLFLWFIDAMENLPMEQLTEKFKFMKKYASVNKGDLSDVNISVNGMKATSKFSELCGF